MISDQHQGLKNDLARGTKRLFSPRLNNATKKCTSRTKFWMLKWILDSLINSNKCVFQRNTIYHREKQVNFSSRNETNREISERSRMYTVLWTEKCSSKCQVIHNHRWKCIIIFYWIWKLMWYRLRCNMYSFSASLLKRLRFL